MEKKVAALFVEENGPYSSVAIVDAWHKDRNALNYSGPYPVVAHPPCQLWGPFAVINYKRYGGSHNKPGNDGGCFEFALNAVRRYGGVIEHPRRSKAFSYYGIVVPPSHFIGWHNISSNEWICTVYQSAYGHKANKSTILFYVGENKPFELNWNRPNGKYQIGWHGPQRSKEISKPTVTKKEAIETPIRFRNTLISLALASNA